MTETYPESGARFFLDLDSVDADEVRYRATIYTPTTRYDQRLILRGAAGHCELSEPPQAPADAPGAAAPPPWTVAHLLALGRQIFRNHKDGPWPRRLTRWRPTPS